MDQSIIAEKIQLDVNISELIESLIPLFEKYSPVVRSPAVSGWAIQSTNSSYKDGWSMDFCPYNGPQNIGPTWTPQSQTERSLRPIQDYVLPTELTTKSMSHLLRRLEEMGFNPRKARIIKLSAGTESTWHQDGSRKFYQVRLHIPLKTESTCFFETKAGRYHMPADGSAYLVHINKPHRVVNPSSLDRYHFVTNIWDQKEITRHHRYKLDQNKSETIHPAST